MLDDQKCMLILIQDGHQLERGESSPNIHLGEIAVKATEDAGIVASYEADPVTLQFKVAIQGID